MKSIVIEKPIVSPSEDLITYKCKDHWKLSDFNALKDEYKNEMERFNNVKKYVTLLTDQIIKLKEVIKKLMKFAPKKKVKEIISDELNLGSDDPLLEAADQLSEPETPNISERFNLQDNIKKDASAQLQQMKMKNIEKERIKMEAEQMAITNLYVIELIIHPYFRISLKLK